MTLSNNLLSLFLCLYKWILCTASGAPAFGVSQSNAPLSSSSAFILVEQKSQWPEHSVISIKGTLAWSQSTICCICWPLLCLLGCAVAMGISETFCRGSKSNCWIPGIEKAVDRRHNQGHFISLTLHSGFMFCNLRVSQQNECTGGLGLKARLMKVNCWVQLPGLLVDCCMAMSRMAPHLLKP